MNHNASARCTGDDGAWVCCGVRNSQKRQFPAFPVCAIPTPSPHNPVLIKNMQMAPRLLHEQWCLLTFISKVSWDVWDKEVAVLANLQPIYTQFCGWNPAPAHTGTPGRSFPAQRLFATSNTSSSTSPAGNLLTWHQEEREERISP